MWPTKMRIHSECAWIAGYFLTILDIFDDESVNSTFINLKNGETKMVNQKLILKIKLSEIRYLGVFDITDYKLEFIT